MKALTAVLLALLAAPALALADDPKLKEAVADSEKDLQAGKPDALEPLLDYTKDHASSPEGWVALSLMQVKAGKADDALQSAAKAAEVAGSASGPAKRDALVWAADVQLRYGASKPALAFAQKAVEAESTAASLAVLARVQARLGLGAALETADKAVAADAKSAAAQIARGDALLAARPTPRPPTARPPSSSPRTRPPSRDWPAR